MSIQQPNQINQLMGHYLELQEQWEDDPQHFNWEALRGLAVAGATAYNEGNGPSFQMLSIDAMQHGEFHSKFLEYSIEAGFDPFKLVLASSGHGVAPVFGHTALAVSAEDNQWSAKMLANLRSLARRRFDSEFVPSAYSKADLEQTLEYCQDSIPKDVVEKLSTAAMALA